MDLLEVLQAQPLRGEPRRERRRPRIGEHPAHLLVEDGRRPQRAARRPAINSLSGGPAQRKNDRRDARSRSLIAVVLAGLRVRRHSSNRKTKCGLARIACERGADAGLEVAAGAAFIVERHQARGILGRERAAVRLPRRAVR